MLPKQDSPDLETQINASEGALRSGELSALDAFKYARLPTEKFVSCVKKLTELTGEKYGEFFLHFWEKYIRENKLSAQEQGQMLSESFEHKDFPNKVKIYLVSTG